MTADTLSITMTTVNEHKNLLDMLQSIGLRQEEALVYLAALELGPSSVWHIFLKSGIKRPTCYVILDDLARRGLASKSNDGKKTIYSVASPIEIAREFDRKRLQFEANLSQFEALRSKSIEKPQIRLYEGIDGVRQAYNVSLGEPEGTEMLVYSTALVLTAYPDFFKSYIAERVRRKIKVRLLLADTEINRSYLQLDEAELRETRFLPKERFDPRAELEIYNDKIVNIAYSDTAPFATVIESSTMAFDERQKFELLWEMAGDKNQESGIKNYGQDRE